MKKQKEPKNPHFKSHAALKKFAGESLTPLLEGLSMAHWDVTLRFGDMSEVGIDSNLRACASVQADNGYKCIVITIDAEHMFSIGYCKEKITGTIEHEILHAIVSPLYAAKHFLIKNLPAKQHDAAYDLWNHHEEQVIRQLERTITALRAKGE